MNPFFSTLAAHPLIPLFLLANLAIGIWAHRQAKVNTFYDYALASRSLPVGVLMVTLIATCLAGQEFSGSDLFYQRGIVHLLHPISLLVVFLFIGTFIAPNLIHFEGCMTMGDLMGTFYGREVHLLIGIVQALISWLVIGTQLNIIGLFSEGLLGIPFSLSVLCFGSLVVLYSCWGGVRAVAYTDVLQLVGAALSFSYVAQATLGQVGGVATLFHRLHSDHPEKLLFFSSPYFGQKVRSVIFWTITIMLTLPTMQRMLIVQDKRDVKKMWYLGGSIYIVLILLLELVGLALILLKADLIPGRVVSGSLFIELVKHLFAAQPWVVDLMFIGFLGVLISTIDSYLHAVGISLVQDIMEPARKLAGLKPIPAGKKLGYARLGICLVGLSAVIIRSFYRTGLLNHDLYKLAVLLSGTIIFPMIAGIIGVRTNTVSWVSFSIAYVTTLGITKLMGLHIYNCYIIAMPIAVIAFFITHYIQNGGIVWLVRTESSIAESLYRPSWQGMMALIGSWLSFPFHLPSFAERKIVKAPIRSLAFSCLIFFLYTLSAVLGSQLGGDALHTITLMTAVRFVGITLCVLLMIEGIWPAVLQPYLPLYWFVTLWYCLPFFSTLTCLLAEGGNFEIGLLAASLFTLFLLVDGSSFLLINTLGVGMATGLYYMVAGGLPVALWNESAYTFLVAGMITCLSLCFLGFRKEGYIWDKLHMNKTAINGLEHEIRNPLNKLGLVFEYFSLASEHNGKEIEDEKGKKFFGLPMENYEFLAKEVDRYRGRMKDITNEIDRFREMVKHQVLGGVNQKAAGMDALVQTALSTLKESFTERTKVSVDIKKDFEIMISKGLFSTVITNLLYNAYKHGGAKEVKVTIDGERRMVVVQDNGRGIPADRVGRVFDLFYTTSGSGIGLALVRMIVESSDGRISCHSRCGENSFTTFTLSF